MHKFLKTKVLPFLVSPRHSNRNSQPGNLADTCSSSPCSQLPLQSTQIQQHHQTAKSLQETCVTNQMGHSKSSQKQSTGQAVSHISAQPTEGPPAHWTSFTWARAARREQAEEVRVWRGTAAHLPKSRIRGRVTPRVWEEMQEPGYSKALPEQGWGSVLKPCSHHTS